MLSTAQVSALTAASTPEDAAQIFKGLVTQVIGQSIAKALDDALGAARSSTADSASIAGWADLISGAAIQMAWDRPPGGKSAGYATYFSPREGGDALRPLGISGGISINVSF